MRSFWFRRRVGGKHWSVWIATPDDCPHMRDGDFAVTVYGERRIYLNPLPGESHYPVSLVHEWQHVAQHLHGLYDHEGTNTRMHQALEDAAVVAAKLPKRMPPKLEDQDE